jgi:hypothetical protein
MKARGCGKSMDWMLMVIGRCRMFAAACILPFVIGICTPVHAQQFGGNSPRTKWKQIDTDTARIIFPENLDAQAQRVANTVHYLNRHARRSIGEKQLKIDIVLQNQSVVSNGYVGIAPFRSELYLNAPQDGFMVGSNWLDVLAIHEYRHALQFMNARQGVTKYGYYLTGELGWRFLSSLSIPNWFWEGDAIVSETASTAQGRGRLPSFYNGYKSLIYSEGTYDYQKARNGSIKDFVPDHYHLGFLLCNYGREQYGNDFWKSVVADAGKYRGWVYPFSGAINRKTGQGTKEFYLSSMDYYQKKWQQQKQQSDRSTLVPVPNKSTFTYYGYPHRMESGDILTYKGSYDKIGGFYKIDSSGNELLLRRQGRVLESYYSYQKGKIAWAELGQDERWLWQTKSNVVLYDIESGKRKRLTSNARFFSPDISHDGKRIVVFQSTPDLQYNLMIISSDDGRVLKRIDNEHNYYFSYPRWSKDDLHIVTVVRDGLGRVALSQIEVATGKMRILVPFSNHQIGIPYEHGANIYFSASFSGIDNIFAVRKDDGIIYQLTDGSLGSYQPNTNGNELLFSRFSSMGNSLMRMPLDEALWKETSIEEPVDMPEYAFVSTEAEGSDITQSIPDQTYETRKYPINSKLVNLYSWSLYFEDPNYEWSLKSNNILNTLIMDLGIRYNRNDEAFTYFFNAEYAQYYPVFALAATTGRRKALLRDACQNVVELQWWESTLKPGITLPFNLSSGLYDRQLTLGGSYSLTNLNFTAASSDAIRLPEDFNYNAYTYSVSFVNRRRKARQNIWHKYSQLINFSFDRSLNAGKASQLFLDTEWTFPGLSPNDNVVFQASFQQEDPNLVPRFGDNFFYARGYNRPSYDAIYKVGANYHLPIAYPDWGFFGVLYLYRLRGNIFFDHSMTFYTPAESNVEEQNQFNSTGAEFIFDTRLFNAMDFTMGFRYSYLLNDDPRVSGRSSDFKVFIPLMRF